MKKIIITLLLLWVPTLIWAQKYSSKTGIVTFEASLPLFEDIFAKDSNNLVILNADTGEIASVSAVKNFHFKTNLMEEHFNENYAETAKYPKTTFKGKIMNFDKNKLTGSPQKFTIQGALNFHGVSNNVTSPATIYIKDNKIMIQGTFIAKTADYKVVIPKMVSKKVAENVNVEYNYTLTKQ